MSHLYRAFITYNHADEITAKWLHARLERFVVPPGLRSQDQPGKTLAPIFRDRDELAASGELTGALKGALQQSAALIVICSPAAARSKWVNAEIDWFRRTNPTAPIACVIVDGEPGDPERECFPAALDHLEGVPANERVSADLRPGIDSKHDALLRVAASLLGVSFDTLKQRHQSRRIRILFAVNITGAFIAAALLVLTWIAFRASEDASRRQGQAEQLVTFMLGDLRERLQAIGRLDILEAIGDESSGYFESLADEDETDTILLSRAKALRQLGDIRLQQGRSGDAGESFSRALALNAELWRRAPSDKERLYELAQAEFWVGNAHIRNADLSAALPNMRRYLEHATTLLELEPLHPDYRLELAYANSNLGTLATDLGNPHQAAQYFAAAAKILRQLIADDPDNDVLANDLAQVISWQATNAFGRGRFQDALSGWEEQTHMLRRMSNRQPANQPRKRMLAVALQLYGEVLGFDGQRQAARDAFTEAWQILAGVAEVDPDNRDWQRNLVRSIWLLGRMAEVFGDLERAFSYYEQAVEGATQLVANDPDQARNRRYLASALASYMRIHRQYGRSRQLEIPSQAAALDVEDLQSLRYVCELALDRDVPDACQKEIALIDEAVQATPTTDALLTLYTLLRSREDARQNDVWGELLKMGVSDRGFVNTR